MPYQCLAASEWPRFSRWLSHHLGQSRNASYRLKTVPRAFLFLLVTLSFAAGCSTQPVQQPPDQLSTPLIALPSIKKMILDNRARLFKDPDSIKDARISEPITCPAGRNTCICIELNARNSYGGYGGMGEMMVHFLTADTPEIFGGDLGELARPYCRGYVPFPELNGRSQKPS